MQNLPESGVPSGVIRIFKRFWRTRLSVPASYSLFIFTVLKAGATSFSLGTPVILAAPAAGSNSVTLAVTPETGIWAASTNAPWIHLPDSFQNGTGSTNIIFTLDENTNATRSGIITIADQTLTIIQAGSNYAPAGVVTLLSGQTFADGIAVDGAGNVYVTIANLNKVLKWTRTNNSVTTVVSSGLNYPVGVAVDSGGNIYIANQDGNTINQGTSAVVTDVNSPKELALDGAGNLYIADNGNTVIKEWVPSSNSLTTLVPIATWNIAVDDAGKNIYFGDGASVKRWSAADNSITELASSSFYVQYGAAVDGCGNIYTAAQDPYHAQKAIMKWSAASNYVDTLITSGSAEYFGVASDKSGNLYFSDAYNGTVQELPGAFVDATTKYESLAAGQDSLPPVVPATTSLLAPFGPVSDSPWLTITGVTNGVVSFAFTQNVGLPRTGHINLLGKSIAIQQAGPIFTLGATSFYEAPLAGSDSVTLGSMPNIGVWTARANVFWLHLASTNGTGGTNIIFTFDANSGATRSGSITISGQIINITQAGSKYVEARPLTTLVSSGLASPSGVAADRGGNVYIAGTINNTIEEWTLTNNAVTPLVSSGLADPAGVVVDSSGTVYIADSSNHAIKVWTATNGLTTLASGFSHPAGLATDNSGNIYIADSGSATVKEWIAASNAVITLISSGLANPTDVAVDTAGNVYIADAGDGTIKKKLVTDGSLMTLISSGLANPNGVAVDGGGNLYIADTGNNAIKEWIATSNTVITLEPAGLSAPSAVAVDGVRNVYVADAGDNTIRELPRAFIDPSAKLEGLSAGTDHLPTVVPSFANLLPPFAPTSDQSWLAVPVVANGVVTFAFATDGGRARTAHVQLLGRSISITQGLVGSTPSLASGQMLANGVFQFSFTNNPSASFAVLSTTNLSLPLSNWDVVGIATNVASNLFEFISQPNTNDPNRYYNVRSPF